MDEGECCGGGCGGASLDESIWYGYSWDLVSKCMPEELRRIDPLSIPDPPLMVVLDEEQVADLGLECERCAACCYHWFVRNLKDISRSYVVKCVHLGEGNTCEVYNEPDKRPLDCQTHWCERIVNKCQK